MPPKRRVPLAQRSLAVFVQSLEGLRVVVELRNDSVVKGQLDAADDGMNLTLSGASWQPLQGQAQTMDFLFIKGSHVRYIHLPGSLNVATRVEAKRKEVAEARKVHELMRGPLSARPKGEEMHYQGAAWDEQQEDEGSEEDMDDMETGSAA